jgi:hypothetical protein
MKILLEFMLHKKDNGKEPFRFWSCVLDASINEEIVDYCYLNQDNEFGIEDFDDCG